MTVTADGCRDYLVKRIPSLVLPKCSALVQYRYQNQLIQYYTIIYYIAIIVIER